jgi:hypothetical protein
MYCTVGFPCLKLMLEAKVLLAKYFNQTILGKGHAQVEMLVKKVLLKSRTLQSWLGSKLSLNSTNNYWSSSEYNSNNSWNLNTNNGNLNNNNKNNNFYVRAFLAL